MGPFRVRVVEANTFGVLDPMDFGVRRLGPTLCGRCRRWRIEVLFTLLRRPVSSDAEFERTLRRRKDCGAQRTPDAPPSQAARDLRLSNVLSHFAFWSSLGSSTICPTKIYLVRFSPATGVGSMHSLGENPTRKKRSRIGHCLVVSGKSTYHANTQQSPSP